MLLLRDLQTLVKAGAVKSACIIPNNEDSFVLVVKTADDNEEVLYTDRKSERKFKTVDAAFKVVLGVGLNEMSFKARNAA